MKLVFTKQDVIDAIAKIRKIDPANIKLSEECPEDLATADVEVVKRGGKRGPRAKKADAPAAEGGKMNGTKFVNGRQKPGAAE